MSALKVATLNFSGINTSPFEYHDGTDEKKLLDSIFKKLFEEEKNKDPEVSWNIAKLDKIYNKDRYSILYRPDCGYVRGRLLTKDQFDVVWDLTFDMSQGIVGHMNLEDEIINKLRTFDWLAYKAFIEFVFGVQDTNNPAQYNVGKYKEELKKWHTKNYLNEDRKIDYVKDYIASNNLDVMFIQEALNTRSLDYLPSTEYSLVKHMDSLIVYRKDLYFQHDKQDLDVFDAKYKTRLNLNKDSVYLKSQNILLMSIHLSSKSINVEQAKQMFETLKEIEEEYKDLVIIIGTDANHCLKDQDGFKVYPDNRTVTTRKKRTHMQTQFEKAGKLVEETKDHILTNQTITAWNISTIKSEKVTNDLLPNDKHPYDHFLISATVKFDKVKYRRMESNVSSALEIRIGSTDSLSEFRKNSILEQVRVVPPEEKVFTRRRTLTTFSNEYQPLDIGKYLSTIDKNQEQILQSRDRRMTRI